MEGFDRGRVLTLREDGLSSGLLRESRRITSNLEKSTLDLMIYGGKFALPDGSTWDACMIPAGFLPYSPLSAGRRIISKRRPLYMTFPLLSPHAIGRERTCACRCLGRWRDAGSAAFGVRARPNHGEHWTGMDARCARAVKWRRSSPCVGPWR
jgi:hypothetical protein